MAHLSDDPGLVQRVRERRRTCTARPRRKCSAIAVEAVSGDQRRAAKAINFGLMYGMSAFGLARQLGIGRGEAQDYIALYFSRYPGVREYMDRTRGQAREDGLRRNRVRPPPVPAGNPARATRRQRAGAERAAINAPMQGTAADIIKRAMIDVDAWLQSDPRARR